MILNRKIKRTILEHKSQYLGSIVLIMISCLLFSMMGTAIDNLDINNKSFKKEYVQEDAQFIVQKNIMNISELETKFNIKLQERKTADYNITENKTLRIFTPTDEVDKLYVVKGKNLSASGEILLDPSFAKAQKVNIGDSYKVYDRKFKVVGFMALPDYIYPLKSDTDLLSNPNSFGVGIISRTDFNELNKGNIFYSIKFKDNNEEDFKKYINENNILIKWLDKQDNSRIFYVDMKIKDSYAMVQGLPVSILLLTCALLGVVMWRTLKQEFSQIGTLYAMGYKKSEIVKHYLSYSVIVALIGSILGTIIGIILAVPILKFYLNFFNLPLLSIKIQPQYSILGLFLPLVFLLPTTLFIINKALRLSPLELIHGGKDKNKVGFIERHIYVDKFKFSTKFKLRELVRNIPRAIFMILGITFASMLLLMGFSIKGSIDYLIKDNYENVYKYNYDYLFNSLQTDNIANSEAYSLSPFVLKDNDKESFVVYGVNTKSRYLSLKNTKGNALSLDNIIITKPLADKLKIKEGQSLTIKNKFNSKKYTVKLDSIADTYIGNYIFMPLDDFNKLLNYPKGSYLGFWSDKKQNIAEDKLLRSVSKEDAMNAYKAMLAPLMYSIGSISLVAFIIGLIVIYVVTALVVDENKSSISLLKVLGYNNKEIYSLVLNSNTLLVILGYLIGIPLIIASLQALFSSVAKQANISFPVKLDIISIIIGFVIIMVTYELCKRLNKRKIDNVSMSDTLKSRLE